MINYFWLKLYAFCAVVCLLVVYLFTVNKKAQVNESPVIEEQAIELSINGYIQHLTLPRDVTIHIIANEFGELTDIQCFNRIDGKQCLITPTKVTTQKWPTNKVEN